MAGLRQTNRADWGSQRPFLPILISLAGHLLLVALVMVAPTFESDNDYGPGIINVQMVELPDLGGVEAKQPSKPQEVPAPAKEIKALEPKAEVPATPPAAETSAEVSVAPEPVKTKTALKYKTYKPQEALKSSLKQLEQRVENQAEQQLQDTIKRLKEQVSKDDRQDSAAPAADTAVQGSGKKPGLFGGNSKEEAQVLDMYRLEVAFSINKNWAFSQNMAGAGDHLVAKVIFKVMPDGTINDIFFTDRSGNAFLDDSAFKAIKKSSPVKPHPPGLGLPYVEMGLRFTPQGVQ